jgi:hypothetical protein
VAPPDQPIFGSTGDPAPDTWGRRLMQRAERRQADREGRRVRTLGELNYLLGEADETRLGALRPRSKEPDGISDSIAFTSCTKGPCFRDVQTKRAWIVRCGSAKAVKCRTGFSVSLTVFTSFGRTESLSSQGSNG